MAGSEEPDSTELQNSDCSFLWDPQTRLYFHASSGFYHDPDAGWYYSSRDGLYYKFENGNYVLLDSCYKEGAVADKNGEEYCSSSQGNGIGAPAKIRNVGDESGSAGQTEGACNQVPENPQPPSEWLEDTLIDLYLSGYNAVNSAADATMSLGTDNSENSKFPSDGTDETYEIEEGEWIPEENHNLADSSEGVPYEGDTWDEENWRAQYGQVTQSGEEPVLEVPVVDLWDWVMMTGPRKDGKGQVARLIGRLVKRSAKVHPSMPSGGGLLKTAPICEVHLDLVRVRTGQVYKLRSPNPRYLASLPTYDSSDPTKDWGFPDLSVNKKVCHQFKSGQKDKSEATGEKVLKDLPILSDQPSASIKKFQQRSHVYRDRAAERRTLHGGFGLGPGQKNVAIGHDSDPTYAEDAKAEALNMSFGAGSYARRILEGMGWKEGEALGSTTKGLTEPLQPIGNIGSAGLGWPQTRRC
ncbi:hypothetical protein QUC31_007067 [Theobroma cacao]|uniref:D111/G-patch domain-containing protein, putative isoform 1 n=1 Tax=Theobroma cacao TaxID=3641 RepID=A0A061FVG7_THECC|nr:D111/G-patch domain-containing protein, putative isoform 1 [Theobroma cacao]EOY20867.1 D111/G-patch domain-containing protein, putative isoform 1 [Theobroma cacao]